MIPDFILPAMPFIGAACLLALRAIEDRRLREAELPPMPRWRMACLTPSPLAGEGRGEGPRSDFRQEQTQ